MRINTWSRSFLLSFDSRRLSRKCNVTLLTHRSRAPAPGTRFTRVINYSRNLTLFLKNYQLSRCRYIHGQFLQSISRSDLLYLNRLSKSSIKTWLSRLYPLVILLNPQNWNTNSTEGEGEKNIRQKRSINHRNEINPKKFILIPNKWNKWNKWNINE